jgi:hypothetical protein
VRRDKGFFIRNTYLFQTGKISCKMASEVTFSPLKYGKDDSDVTVVTLVFGLQPALLENARGIVPASRR